MTSLTKRDTQLNPLLLPLWLQDTYFIFLKGNAVHAIYVTLPYDTVPTVVFYRNSTLQNKNKKAGF